MFVYIIIDNTITLKSLVDKYAGSKCVVLNNVEEKHMARIASQCNNGSKSEECFVSRWCVEPPSKNNDKFKATIDELISCYHNKNNEICHSIVMQSKYERPLYVDGDLLNRNAILDNNSNCGYITKKEMKRNGYKELLDYSNMLAINPDLYTYCLDNKRMTLLIQREGHNSEGSNDHYEGCKSKYCLIEVITLHNRLKKISN
jgi:hypothetical protein